MIKAFGYVIGIFLMILMALAPAKAQQARDVSGDVYYEIFVRSFKDSNGDGIGDLQGVIAALDYLQDLGITGIWLMPIHPSPSYHGYDIIDYYGINPAYGNLEDFKSLLQEAHQRGIKVMLDLVINHTSNFHPWFQRFREGEVPYDDYYVWSDEKPDWRGVSGSPAWHALDERYYLGLFWSGMPDLNLSSQALTQELYRMVAYWLNLGVDAFRFDAVQHLIESDSGSIRNTLKPWHGLKPFEAFIKTVNPAAFIVAETWTDSETIAKYHREADLDLSFNYPIYNALIGGIQNAMPAIYNLPSPKI
ncbi:MAG: alpha-amylase family glycosyl hydrolase [Deinococcales bacterium]